MSVSDGYLTFVLDQLRTLVPVVRVRRMFGACGLYAGDLFFAVIDDDTFYLKVDDESRAEYEVRGMPAFQPPGGTPSKNYSQLPEELLDEPEALRPWVERAIEVAGRGKVKRNGRKSTKTSSSRPGRKKANEPEKKSAKKAVKKPKRR